MDKPRELLATFITERQATRIADDLPALADLAAKHELKFATLDAGIKLTNVELIS